MLIHKGKVGKYTLEWYWDNGCMLNALWDPEIPKEFDDKLWGEYKKQREAMTKKMMKLLEVETAVVVEN